MVQANSVLDSFKKYMDQVNKENLMDYTRKISSEVRLSGSSEEFRTFQFVKETLEGFGLRTNLYLNDAYISLPVQASLKINDKNIPCITHSMGVSTPNEGLTGEMIYVAKGTNKDYEPVNVKGKIVLLDGLAVPGAVKKAQEEGASAAIFINAEYTHEMIVSPVWGNPTPETFSLLPKVPVISINYHDGIQLKQIIQERVPSLPKVWLYTVVDTGWRKIPTLTADLQADSHSDQYVLFSGHIDSWHYGAMDNGTANATMIEIARIFANHQLDLKRNIRFAFWSGHSHGRYAGSALYCDLNWEDLHDHCILHLNVDSVGAKDAVILSEANCMAETKDLGGSIIEEFTGQTFLGTRFGRAGDQSFLGAGVPSLFMGLSEQEASSTPATEAFAQLFGGGRAGGFGWWWHTTEDTIDKIDPNNLERDCKIYVAVLAKACTERVIPIKQVAAVSELKHALLEYQKLAGNKLDLSISLERINTLSKLVTELQHTEVSDEKLDILNKGILTLSRILVPLNYVKEDRFHHDLAMKQVVIPALADIEKLSVMSEDEEMYHMLKTKLLRNHNKVSFSLREAIEKLTDLLDQIQ